MNSPGVPLCVPVQNNDRVVCDDCGKTQLNLHRTRPYSCGCYFCGHLYGTYAGRA